MFNKIPIEKGVYKTKDTDTTINTSFCENLINIFIDSAGGNYDRPCLASFSELLSTETIGISYFDGVFVCVTQNRKVYSVTNAGVVTDITGDTLAGTDIPTFTYDDNNLYIAGGSTPLKWAGIGNTTATLGGSPPEISHIVYLDGYLIGNVRNVSGNKSIRFCDFNTPETWTGTNIFSANAAPDEVQGLAVSQRELYVVGEVTTEVWQNIGAFPIPFERTFIWQFGTIAPYSIISADNSVFLLDQDRRFLRFAGREFVRISEGIEEEIAKYTTVSDAIGCWFYYNASVHVAWIFPTEGKMWSMDTRNQNWTEWRSYNNEWIRPKVGALWYSKELKKTLVGDFSTAVVYTLDDTVKTDAGLTFVRQRTFSSRDGGASIKKQANLLRFFLKRGVASEYTGTESETNPILEVRWQDDGKFWSNWRQISLGEKNNLKKYADIKRLGIFRSRKYEFRFTDPSPLSISSVETDEEALTE